MRSTASTVTFAESGASALAVVMNSAKTRGAVVRGKFDPGTRQQLFPTRWPMRWQKPLWASWPKVAGHCYNRLRLELSGNRGQRPSRSITEVRNRTKRNIDDTMVEPLLLEFREKRRDSRNSSCTGSCRVLASVGMSRLRQSRSWVSFLVTTDQS